MRHGGMHSDDPQMPVAGCPSGGPAGRRGDYGYLFPDLPNWPGLGAETDAVFDRLAFAMRERIPMSPEDDNPGVPAGYTYLGQFIVHDLTHFRATGHGAGDRGPAAARNVSSPRLDLDCLYGAGPAHSPVLYARAPVGRDDYRYLLRIGHTGPAAFPENAHLGDGDPFDVPRIAETAADPARTICVDPLIADPRNDDHVVISQLHVAFARLHNRVAALVKARGRDNRTAYREARRFLTTCYRAVIRHDFLPRVLCAPVYEDFLRDVPLLVRLPEGSPLADGGVALEFSLAVGRFGHAMARGVYRINSFLDDGFATLGRMLDQSAFAGNAESRLPLSSDWVVEWRNFFDLGNGGPQPSRRIGPFLAYHLVDRRPAFAGATEQNRGLAWFDLKRSHEPGLPSGQALASRIRELAGLQDGFAIPVLTGEALLPDAAITGQFDAVNDIRAVLDSAPRLLTDTPLFLYVLLEAHRLEHGLRLGPVGSYVVAVTLRRALGRLADAVDPAIRTMPQLLSLIGRDDAHIVDTLKACTGFDPGPPAAGG